MEEDYGYVPRGRGGRGMMRGRGRGGYERGGAGGFRGGYRGWGAPEAERGGYRGRGERGQRGYRGGRGGLERGGAAPRGGYGDGYRGGRGAGYERGRGGYGPRGRGGYDPRGGFPSRGRGVHAALPDYEMPPEEYDSRPKRRPEPLMDPFPDPHRHAEPIYEEASYRPRGAPRGRGGGYEARGRGGYEPRGRGGYEPRGRGGYEPRGRGGRPTGAPRYAEEYVEAPPPKRGRYPGGYPSQGYSADYNAYEEPMESEYPPEPMYAKRPYGAEAYGPEVDEYANGHGGHGYDAGYAEEGYANGYGYEAGPHW